MALFDCSECGNQVSNQAANCPQCGAPVKGGVALKPARSTFDALPSGDWTGSYRYWWGWSAPMNATFTFGEGTVKGQGSDRVGPFSIDGSFDPASGKVSFSKIYSRHRVFYKGVARHGGIWGSWEISFLTHGSFVLNPVS